MITQQSLLEIFLNRQGKLLRIIKAHQVVEQALNLEVVLQDLVPHLQVAEICKELVHQLEVNLRVEMEVLKVEAAPNQVLRLKLTQAFIIQDLNPNKEMELELFKSALYLTFLSIILQQIKQLFKLSCHWHHQISRQIIQASLSITKQVRIQLLLSAQAIMLLLMTHLRRVITMFKLQMELIPHLLDLHPQLLSLRFMSLTSKLKEQAQVLLKL